MNELKDKFMVLSNRFQKDEEECKNIVKQLIDIFIKMKWFVPFIPLLIFSLLIGKVLPMISIIGIVIFSLAALCETAGLVLFGYTSIVYYNLIKINAYIDVIKKKFDKYFYLAYVLTDYFKDDDYSFKDMQQMNKYLSKFDVNEPNSCFNEIGMKYNYSHISEDKILQIEDKEKDKIENVKEFKVITDTSLVDKYLEQPLLLEDDQIGFGSSINNLELKPGVFDSNKKKLNKENNGYTHIEISIGKVKVLTIDKKIK